MVTQKTPKKDRLTATQARAARRERQSAKSKIKKWLITIAVSSVAILLILGLIAPMLTSLSGN
tara:strand:- start:20708 stop:20896 length:189 start_codon:yes stop_codon:yes gene_type:complete